MQRAVSPSPLSCVSIHQLVNRAQQTELSAKKRFCFGIQRDFLQNIGHRHFEHASSMESRPGRKRSDSPCLVGGISSSPKRA